MEKFDFTDIAIVTIEITNIAMKKFEFMDIAIVWIEITNAASIISNANNYQQCKKKSKKNPGIHESIYKSIKNSLWLKWALYRSSLNVSHLDNSHTWRLEEGYLTTMPTVIPPGITVYNVWTGDCPSPQNQKSQWIHKIIMCRSRRIHKSYCVADTHLSSLQKI